MSFLTIPLNDVMIKPSTVSTLALGDIKSILSPLLCPKANPSCLKQHCEYIQWWPHLKLFQLQIHRQYKLVWRDLGIVIDGKNLFCGLVLTSSIPLLHLPITSVLY